jgi:hypothetical protein
MLSEAAGAEVRRALDTAVFRGMLGVTRFGIVLTPVFYCVIQRFEERHDRSVVDGTPALPALLPPRLARVAAPIQGATASGPSAASNNGDPAR